MERQSMSTDLFIGGLGSLILAAMIIAVLTSSKAGDERIPSDDKRTEPGKNRANKSGR